MVQLLVKTGDQSSHVSHFKDGDVVCIRPDSHVWGREESLDVWLSESRDPKDWPGQFTVVHVPDGDVSDFAFLLDEVRRAHKVDCKSTPTNPTKTSHIVLNKAQLLQLHSVKAGFSK